MYDGLSIFIIQKIEMDVSAKISILKYVLKSRK